MLDGRSSKAGKKTAKQQEAEDKKDKNVLRVAKPNSPKGWGFRADAQWAIANLDKIAAFLGPSATSRRMTAAP